MEFCTPVTIFLVISAIGLISQAVGVVQSYSANNLLILIGGALGTLLWFLLLNYLCSIDWTGLAWFLVLLPLLLFVFMLLLIIEIVVLARNGSTSNSLYSWWQSNNITTMPSTTMPSTTMPSKTMPSTTMPSTTMPSTTMPSRSR